MTWGLWTIQIQVGSVLSFFFFSPRQADRTEIALALGATAGETPSEVQMGSFRISPSIYFQSPFSWFCSQTMWGTQKIAVWVVEFLVGIWSYNIGILYFPNALIQRTREAAKWLVIHARMYRARRQGMMVTDRSLILTCICSRSSISRPWGQAAGLGGRVLWNHYLVLHQIRHQLCVWRE